MPDFGSSTKSVANVAPPRRICELVSSLYSELAKNWPCSCQAQHEARLCVNVPFGGAADGLPTRLELFISSRNAGTDEHWQESSVHLDVDM
jgi:hypothetical protein